MGGGQDGELRGIEVRMQRYGSVVMPERMNGIWGKEVNSWLISRSN